MATPNNEFRLRLIPNTSYYFVVFWGDGTSEVFNGTTPVYQGATGPSNTWVTQISTISASWPGISHKYDTPGNYKISISEMVPGGFPGLQFQNLNETNIWDPSDEFSNDANKVTAITQWGTINWDAAKSMYFSFEGCNNLRDVATDSLTGSLNRINTFWLTWTACTKLTSFGLIDTSNATSLYNAWNSNNIKVFPPINTSLVTDFDYAFAGSYSITNFPIIDTSKGTKFNYTWAGCSSLTSFPDLNLKSAVSVLNNTWENCTSMLYFNTTAISACTSLSFTWRNCRSLREFPLIDSRNVTSCDRVWENCDALSTFPLIDMSKNTGRLYACWNECDNLRDFPLLDTKNVYDFGYAWTNCQNLTSFPLLSAHNVTLFNNTWRGCKNLKEFPLINPIKGTDFTNAWGNCYNLTSFPLLSTPNAKNFSGAWSNCRGLTEFPLLTTSSVENLSYAWATWEWGQVMNLKYFPLIDTSKVTNFSYAWNGNVYLSSFPEINLSSANNLQGAWNGCIALTSFPTLTTNNVTNFSYTWTNCQNLTSFPLLNLSRGKTFYSTWAFCRNLSADSFPINLNTPDAIDYGSAFSTHPGRDDTILMLEDRTALTRVPDFLLNPVNTAKVTDFSNTWNGCVKLLNFSSNISMLSANSVAGAWGNCYLLTSFPSIVLSSVKIFGNRSGSMLYSIDPGNLVTGGTWPGGNFGGDAWLNGSGAWSGCYNITSFPFLSTHNGELFDCAWYGMRRLREFPEINISKGNRFEKTWSFCTSLTSFPTLNFLSATNIIGAFNSCTALRAMPDINTSNVRFMGAAWSYCLSLTEFPSLTTSKVTSLYHESLGGGAWQQCVSLTSFPFIDTSNVTNFKNAWKNCFNLSASPFPTLNMNNMRKDSNPGNFFGNLYDNDGARQSGEGGSGCFAGVKLQTQSWSALLTSLCANNFNLDVVFDGGNSKRNSEGTTALMYLTAVRNWTITDGGEE